MENLLALQNKLNILLRKYSELDSEKERLLKTIEKQKEILSKQEQMIENLKKEATFSAINQVSDVLSIERKSHLKQQIDQVIQEIDRNISLLK